MADQATIFYPNNTLRIPLNIKDSVIVTYGTSWPQVNVTLLCRAATSSVSDFYNHPQNPLPPSGSCTFDSFESLKLNVRDFPADCTYRLTKYGSQGINNDGSAFVLSSTQGSARTFAISTTIGLATSTSSAATLTTSTSSVTTTSSANSTGTANSTPQSTNSSAPSSGTSPATSAAIGIGVGLGVFLILVAALLWFLCFRRRQRKRKALQNVSKSELQGNIPHTYFDPKSDQSRVPFLGGVSMKFGTPIMEKDGSRIVEMPVPNQQSAYDTRSVRQHERYTRHELA